LNFQEIILTLHKFWSEKGCVILQPYDIEVGAGTFHPATFLRVLGPEPWKLPMLNPQEGQLMADMVRTPTGYQHLLSVSGNSQTISGGLPGFIP